MTTFQEYNITSRSPGTFKETSERVALIAFRRHGYPAIPSEVARWIVCQPDEMIQRLTLGGLAMRYVATHELTGHLWIKSLDAVNVENKIELQRKIWQFFFIKGIDAILIWPMPAFPEYWIQMVCYFPGSELGKFGVQYMTEGRAFVPTVCTLDEAVTVLQNALGGGRVSYLRPR